MAYFGGSTQMTGDPGLFSTFKRLAQTAVSFATGGPVAAVGTAFRKPSRGAIAEVVPTPGIRGAAERFFPGGRTGLQVGVQRKRRRMNVTNDKALRRAIRRQAGFVKLAKKALKGTGYQIVSSASLATSRAKTRSAADIHHAS